MTIDTKTVTKIAKLSRIAVTEGDKEPLARELSGIMQWIEQLQEVNTDNVAPTSGAMNTKLPWRKDEVTDGNIQAEVLKNAPSSDFGCFVVPKVIE